MLLSDEYKSRPYVIRLKATFISFKILGACLLMLLRPEIDEKETSRHSSCEGRMQGEILFFSAEVLMRLNVFDMEYLGNI